MCVKKSVTSETTDILLGEDLSHQIKSNAGGGALECSVFSAKLLGFWWMHAGRCILESEE